MMLVSTPVRTVPRFDRVALAQAASSAPPWAAGVVPRAAVGLLYVLFEDARLLLAVVICVREPSQTLPGTRVERECEGKDAAPRSLRRTYHHLYPSLCGLGNSDSSRDISPRSYRPLAAGRAYRPSGSGFGCRARRRRASG